MNYPNWRKEENNGDTSSILALILKQCEYIEEGARLIPGETGYSLKYNCHALPLINEAVANIKELTNSIKSQKMVKYRSFFGRLFCKHAWAYTDPYPNKVKYGYRQCVACGKKQESVLRIRNFYLWIPTRKTAI